MMKRFIAIDGLDGSGKDTQARLIKEKYEKEGTVIVRSHPTSDNFFGNNSKAALEKGGKLNKIIATLCYGGDAIRSVIKYYNKADTVIFVRYTLAVSYLNKVVYVLVYKLVCFVLPVSEYFFYLDVSPEKLVERVQNRNEKEEMFENYDAFVKVRAKAENVLYNWHVIPADDAPDVIFNKIETILDDLDSKLLNES
ncbi:nucleoside/nucleotide kinase family protein [Methanobrevibacter olleyae]|uniref:Thymidylate kinase Tmk n=1 Tax=Methanobrevibacter olleyae TaxID=294671 RepID=A0A126QYJ5_METOL|nr:thymidylate kinase [Methanobrevibacter olleyae]AMK15233.1 thymidylate kinase Tmk [Methanobrevibacter olleyae]